MPITNELPTKPGLYYTQTDGKGWSIVDYRGVSRQTIEAHLKMFREEYPDALIEWLAIPDAETLLAMEHKADQWDALGYLPSCSGLDDTERCPGCGGVADNGFDRCVPPTAYLCSKCAT